jgi:type IX secretion system substrate protein
MKKKYKLLLLLIIFVFMKSYSQAQAFCDTAGNIVIFSNYDGGILRINVDVNIPNLKIGITGYENDSILISGAYVNNITQVIFAGYYNSSNVHCNPWPSQKSISGVSAAITQINFVPPSTYNNPYGYLYIICNTSCSDSTSQGGCNTPDQVADYFFNQFGTTKLMFHYTQYGCWNGIYNLSAGGNCCAVPTTTGISENVLNEHIRISPNPSGGTFQVSGLRFEVADVSVYNVYGEEIDDQTYDYKTKNVSGGLEIDLSDHPAGVYLLKIAGENVTVTKKIIVE